MFEPSVQAETLLAMLESMIDQKYEHDKRAEAIEEFLQDTRNAALEEAAQLVESKTDYTLDVTTGKLVEDKDGPWILNLETAADIRAKRTV